MDLLTRVGNVYYITRFQSGLKSLQKRRPLVKCHNPFVCHLSKHFVCKVAQDSLDQLEMTSRQVYHKADLNLSPSTKWFNLLTHQITYTNYAFPIRQAQHLVCSDASHTTRGMTVTVFYDQDILKETFGDFFMTLR